MRSAETSYLPAAGRDWLLPLYDPLTRLLGVGTVHRNLIHQAAIEQGHRVLEIGCGTGNLAILTNRLCSAAQVVGIDPDQKALARARRKAEQKRAGIRFDHGFAEALPYPDASFDRVLSALMLHHLQPEAKRVAIREARRVLGPGGSLHVVDFGGQHHGAGGLHGLLARIAHVPLEADGGLDIMDLMHDAGLENCKELARENTLAGQIRYWSAVRRA